MMLCAAAMQRHEQAVIQAGTSAAVLMDRAADGITALIRDFFLTPGTLVCYCGSGNNGGDALAVARRLAPLGWQVLVRFAAPPESLRELPRLHWLALGEAATLCQNVAEVVARHRTGPLLLLDGLIGLGSQGPLRPALATLAAEMNGLRTSHHAFTLAMDLPSGLDPDTGLPSPGTVIADMTATIAVAKCGLVADAATAHVGRLAVIPVEGLEPTPDLQLSAEHLALPSRLLPLLPRRSFLSHKGQSGRVAILAGTAKMPGAALLACLGAIRGGAGLVTLWGSAALLDRVANRLPPEVMLRETRDLAQAASSDADVLAIGPGLGAAHDAEILALVKTASQPMVVDADALNALARQGVPAFSAPRLLTPHPGEMARLQPVTAAPLSRQQQAETFATAHPGCTLLLKGSRTVVATHDQPTTFNTTGHPGMAGGGFGDVLTGLCSALLAQGMNTHAAAIMGSWLLGRTAEKLLFSHHQSPQSLTASDVAQHLGLGFNALVEGGG